MKTLFNQIAAAWAEIKKDLEKAISKQVSKKAAQFRKKYEQAKKDPAVLTELLYDSVSNMTGKLEHLRQIGTSALYNKRCQERAKDPRTICSKCYAIAQMLTARGRNLALKLERNTILWASDVIPVDIMPLLNDCIFRLESFGDLINTTQFINYIHLCRRNPWTTFTIWTKNPDIIALVFKMTAETKPENMIIIYSDPVINGASKKAISAILKKYSFIDKVFTVYEADYAKQHKEIIINCRNPENYSDKHCITCRNCYEHNNIKNIGEILK